VPAHHRTPQASFFQTKQINPEEKMYTPEEGESKNSTKEK
jgi:hypothetical protein